LYPVATGHSYKVGAPVTQKSSLYRRSSGIYVVRVVVPVRLRRLVGKGEIHISTGTRTPSVAKAVAAGTMAAWRQKFLTLESMERMDLHRLSVGSPLLNVGGFLSLHEASEAAGFNEEELLRKAAEGVLTLFARLTASQGHVIPEWALEREQEGDRYITVVPQPSAMPKHASPVSYTGIVKVRDGREVASALLAGVSPTLVLFDLPDQPGKTFAPDAAILLTRRHLELASGEVEALRVVTLAAVTPGQLVEAERARVTAPMSPAPRRSTLRLSDAIDRFMRERAVNCSADRARRLRDACDLFVELMGDSLATEVTREMLRAYRDECLPKVPAKMHLLRHEHPEIANSTKRAIELASPEWPRLSATERRKRMGWLAGLFEWLRKEREIAVDPAEGLVQGVLAQDSEQKKRKLRNQDGRDAFTDSELAAIFSASWFQNGRGERTKAGTYREYLPLYYWLPLLGLHTGARINELCQLKLTDIRQTESGVWFIDITDSGDDQSVKNRNSLRNVPLHPFLIDHGLIEWCQALHGAGYDRLFPELRHDADKGYSKAAVKWFSSYLGRMGWPRDGRKTFHSFRHTFITRCTNDFKIDPAVTGQITGHERGASSGIVPYMKNQLPDDVLPVMKAIEYSLPAIHSFDVEAGLQAVKDAFKRKEGVRPRLDS